MGLIDRLLERKLEKMGVVPETKAAGFMAVELERYPSGRPDTTKIAEYTNFIDAYKALPWLYAGALAVAIALPKAKLRVYQGVNGEKVEITDEDINDLLRRPNPHLSYRELMQITAINMQITGNHYWNLVGTAENSDISAVNPPVEIWWIKPEDIQVKLGGPDNFIQSYVYKGKTKDEKFLDPSEIIPFRLPNPDSYYLGMGALEPAKNSAILELNAVNYNKKFMKNDAVPAGLFNFPDRPTTDQLRQHRRMWDETHRGADKTGKMGYTYGGIEFKELGKSPKDAQYIEMRRMNREEMLATLGVPPSVVGLLEYANYSNMEVQQKKFWEDAVTPLAGLIQDRLTLQLAPLFDDSYYFEFDYSDIKVLQEDEERKATVATMLVSHGIKTINEVRKDMYSLESADGGDALRIPISWVELGAATPATDTPPADEGKLLPAPPSPTPTEAKSFWADETRRRVLWDAFIKRTDRRIDQMEPMVLAYLKDQAKRLQKAVSEWGEIPDPLAVFDEVKETELYVEALWQLYVDIAKEGGEAGLRATEGKIYSPDTKDIFKDDEIPFELLPEFQEELRRIIVESGTQINMTTMQKVVDFIKGAALDDWTVEDLTQAIFARFDELSVGKSRVIANTEAAKVDNRGQLEGYKQSEFVDQKEWLSAFLPDTRETHAAANGQVRILDQPFNIGGALVMYPGDPAGGAENSCNCKCDTAPVVMKL